ncbi:sulfite exporter TauE/SafE family protein [Oceaniglobus trochenteri]|uniref:sulfite exporter TauE/SafE family protein n=1 Tax=Oceaniglobus trochenteri TaxID=2763260 RepID=UPI001CFFEE8F|nr:sulfite exporter TauE/SafE family protein [Oceaniglobus trochenteri]
MVLPPVVCYSGPMIELDLLAYGALFVALAMGGTLKGATGMGAPIIAIPVMATFFDVRLAIVVLVLPNLLTNLRQLWQYRSHDHRRFSWHLAIAGAVGAILGSFLLATVPARALTLTVGFVVLGYVALRIWRTDFRLARKTADRIVLPVGLAAGVLQGAAGISAPISISFLNALGLPRHEFIPTISLFFAGMCAVQFPTLAVLGFYDAQMVLLSALAFIPLWTFMPLGAWLTRSISQRAFDWLILGVLIVLAVKLILWP